MSDGPAPSPAYLLAKDLDFRGVSPASGLLTLAPAELPQRRLQQYAAANGLVLAPQDYSLTLSSNQAGGLDAQFQLVVDGNEGPYFLFGLELGEPADVNALHARVQLQSGARNLIDGIGRYLELVHLPRSVARQPWPAPIIVYRQDTFYATLRRLLGTWSTGDTLFINGAVLRTQDGSRVGPLADAIADAIRAEGEFYAIGTASDGEPDNDNTQNANFNAILQQEVISLDTSTLEGTVTASSLQWWLGNYQGTPRPTVPRELLAIDGANGVRWAGTWGHAYPLRKGNQARVSGTWATDGILQPVQALFMGRRSFAF